MRGGRRVGEAGMGAGGLTPMLDVLFILLFALLALSDVRTSDRSELLRIELPRVEPGADIPLDEMPRLVIEIDASSKVRLPESGVRVDSVEHLEAALSGALGEAPPDEIVVEIQADLDARHGVAVELLQFLRNRGFLRVELVALGHANDESFLGGRE